MHPGSIPGRASRDIDFHHSHIAMLALKSRSSHPLKSIFAKAWVLEGFAEPQSFACALERRTLVRRLPNVCIGINLPLIASGARPTGSPVRIRTSINGVRVRGITIIRQGSAGARNKPSGIVGQDFSNQ